LWGGGVSLRNSLYLSLFAGENSREKFGGDYFHRQLLLAIGKYNTLHSSQTRLDGAS
jgi:hypothetical protein